MRFMADYTRTVTVAAAPDAAFDALTDPANLPRYVATMVTAEPEQGEEMHVAAEVEGRREEGEAHVHVDRDARRMEWSASGASDYRGRLDVAPDGAGSIVTIAIHVVHDADEGEIERALDETARNIEALLSER